MFRFWYRFVAPNLNNIVAEHGHMVYEKNVKPYLDDFMGFVFELICTDYLNLSWDKTPSPSFIHKSEDGGAIIRRKSDRKKSIFLHIIKSKPSSVNVNGAMKTALFLYIHPYWSVRIFFLSRSATIIFSPNPALPKAAKELQEMMKI